LQRDNVVRYRSNKNRKGVSKSFWLLLLSFTAIVLAVLYLASPLALVDQIDIMGNEYLSSTDILKEAGIETGMHIWQLSLASSRDKLSANPWISEVHLSRQFLNTISIKLKERTGVVVLAGKEQSWVVAGDGVVLTKNIGFSLPWVTGLDLEEDLGPGTTIDGQGADLAFEFIIAFQVMVAQISEINFEHYPVYISVFTTDGYKILFDTNSPGDRVQDMIALLQELRNDRQKGIIDFRSGPGRGIFSPLPSTETGTDN